MMTRMMMMIFLDQHESFVRVLYMPLSGIQGPCRGFVHWKWILMPKHVQGVKQGPKTLIEPFGRDQQP